MRSCTFAAALLGVALVAPRWAEAGDDDKAPETKRVTIAISGLR